MAVKRRQPTPGAPRAWQRMLSGRRLDLLDPSPLDVEIEDIAHGLARVARWNGQTEGPNIYSVAQHSLLVETIARQRARLDRRRRLAVLLHDAPEYVIGDMISPFKAVIGDAYQAVEARLLAAVHLRFGLAPVLPDDLVHLIKAADRSAAYLEATRLAGFSSAEARRFSAKRPNSRPSSSATISRLGRRRLPRNATSIALPGLPGHDRACRPEAQTCQDSSLRNVWTPTASTIPMIHVCSLARLHDTVEESGALHVVTLLKDTDRVERPKGVLPANHLVLGMDDITMPMDGYTIPCDEHVSRLIEFVRGWGRAKPLVVHCFAGISRSTAGAFVAACTLNPARDELAIARDLRRRSATAAPNARIVSLADRMLGRGGRMVAAIDSIGRGAMAYEGVPFRLDLE